MIPNFVLLNHGVSQILRLCHEFILVIQRVFAVALPRTLVLLSLHEVWRVPLGDDTLGLLARSRNRNAELSVCHGLVAAVDLLFEALGR